MQAEFLNKDDLGLNLYDKIRVKMAKETAVPATGSVKIGRVCEDFF